MNKAAIFQLVLASLDAELASYARSARSAHAEATDEQSKAENKYDTRGLEASYLAKGQSRLAAECMQARHDLERLAGRRFSEDEPADMGALVTVEIGGETSSYLLAPRAGGTEVQLDTQTILVITPASPLGSQLMSKRAGERFQIRLAGRSEECALVQVI